MPLTPRPIEHRIMDKFLVGDGCWIWTAMRDKRGYGRIASGTKYGIPLLAHRVMYEMLVGPVPDGLELDHLCRVTSCVRPDHLEPVTHRENMARGEWATKTHCPAGHEYNEENTMRRSNRRSRECRACKKARR